MLKIRRDRDIHTEDGGWFQARWHFSFGRYRHPAHMGLGVLRVFNDDRIVAGATWPMHPHAGPGVADLRDRTTFRARRLPRQRRPTGAGSGAGDALQSRGRRALRTNASSEEPLRFLQFWILPSTGLTTGVQQHRYAHADRADRWLQIMGPAGEDGLDLSQDARVRVTHLSGGTTLSHTFGEGRVGYVYLIDGQAQLDDDKLTTGDAAKIYGFHDLTVHALQPSELMLFDVVEQFERVGVWAR